MPRLVIFVAGIVVDALSTLIARNSKEVPKKLREAATLAAQKLRDAFRRHPRKEQGRAGR